MNFEYSDEQRMIADTVCGLLSDTNEENVWQALADAGIAGITFTEDHGGAGLDLLTLIPAMVELGRNTKHTPLLAGAILPGLLSARCDIVDFDPSRLIETGQRVAVALPENLDGVQIDNGVISGRIENVLGGAEAEILLICRESAEGVACTALDLTNATVTVTKQLLVDGQTAADIALDKIEVAWSQAERDLPGWLSDVAALLLCAMALGSAEAMKELTLDYIKTRKQFGKPIGNLQVLQHQMVDIFHDTEHFSSLVYAAASACDGADITKRQKAVSAMKRFCGKRMRTAAASSIQMHGGIGVTEEYELNTYTKRILLADMLYGTSDEHAARLGALLAEEARKEAETYGWEQTG